MEALRFGICGTGAFGRTRARALTALAGARVALGWSRSAATRQRFTDELDAPAVESWQALCESPDVDAVLVCSTNVDHFPHARAALAAGKHVLVEVPLSMTRAQAGELAALAEANGRVLHHGRQWRYHPEYAAFLDQTRRVGPLLFGVDHESWDFGPSRRWNADPARVAGGRDFLAYFIPRWLEAFGEVARVTGSQARADGWAAASVTLQFEAGGFITVSYALGEGLGSWRQREVHGRGGSLRTESDESTVLTTADGEVRADAGGVDLVRCECEAFRDEILSRRDHRPALELDLRAMALVDEALPM